MQAKAIFTAAVNSKKKVLNAILKLWFLLPCQKENYKS
jgi:hypothetical protein